MAFSKKYARHIPNSKYTLKIMSFAFFYIAIGSFFYSLMTYLYFDFPAYGWDSFNFFVLYVGVGIFGLGLGLGYLPTYLGGVALYFIISLAYSKQMISKKGAAFLGLFIGWIPLTIAAIYMLITILRRGFPATLFIHYAIGCLIACTIGAIAGMMVYSDVKKQFQEAEGG